MSDTPENPRWRRMARAAVIESTDLAFDVVDLFEAAGTNEDHKWLSRSGKAVGPALIVGGLVLGVIGLKGAAAFGGAKAVGLGVVALKGGILMGFRGVRAIRPRRSVAGTKDSAQ